MGKRKLFNCIMAFVVISALLLGGGINGAEAKKHHGDRVAFWLFLHHNNDGESALLPEPIIDEADNQIGTEGGVAYFASVLWRERIKSRIVKPLKFRPKRGQLLVSSGDNFLAGPAFTASLENGIFYDARALDMLNYDAIAFGNHDFDFGPEVLARFISEGYKRLGRPPYLSVNLDFSGEPALNDLYNLGVIAKSTVVREAGERIGIIGAITPALATISSPRNVVVLQNVAELVQQEINKLEKKGVNKIILISHLQSIKEDQELIPLLKGVDIAVAGGGDELLANANTKLLPSDQADDDGDGKPDAIAGPYPIWVTDAENNQVPVVTTAGQYGYLGRLVAGFDKHGNLVKIDEDRSGPVRVVSGPFRDAVKPDMRMQRKVVEPIETFVADLAANVIATSEVELNGRRGSVNESGEITVPGVRNSETNEGNLIADALRWQATRTAGDFGAPTPDVALQNGGGIRNDAIIPAGNITELDTFSMVPFPNFVAVLTITRDQFKQILENAVSRVEFGDGRFAQVSGFTFTYDPAGTPMQIDVDGNVTQAGARVQEVVLNNGATVVSGGAVLPGGDVTVATIDFLVRGGDQYPFGGAPFTVLGASYQQALSNYIQAPTADGGLGGVISAADYPEGGESRINQVPIIP